MAKVIIFDFDALRRLCRVVWEQFTAIARPRLRHARQRDAQRRVALLGGLYCRRGYLIKFCSKLFA